jgi:hypothetical protein
MAFPARALAKAMPESDLAFAEQQELRYALMTSSDLPSNSNTDHDRPSDRFHDSSRPIPVGVALGRS